MEGVVDFGWSMYVDNPLEDLQAPQYVPGSLSISLSDTMVEERDAQLVRVTWQIDEDVMMNEWGVYASVTSPTAERALEGWGTFDRATMTATVDFYITEFHTPGVWGVPYVMMNDAAGNLGDQRFSNSPLDEPRAEVEVSTSNPDTVPPQVALNDDTELGLHGIIVSAEPLRPEAPDGETLVTIQYQARDDKSGLGVVGFRLLDPQGISHHDYHYHDNFYTLFFEGDPTEWSEYEITTVLPVGSPPGVWGLQELELYDKVANRQYYNFVETVHFVVEGDG
jgi:hypothetical protein